MQKRSRMFIDQQVQGALAFRVTYYWVLLVWGMYCLLAGFPLLFNWLNPVANGITPAQILHGTWVNFRLPMIASFLMVPFLIRDVIRLSHRHVGPIYRLRNALTDLADGKPAAPVQFRKDDVWGDLAEQFNRVVERLQAAEIGGELDSDPESALAEEVDPVGA